MPEEEDNKIIIMKITPIQQIISSCSGALVTSLTMTPLDVVKIRLQSQRQPMHVGQQFLYSNGLMDHVCTCVNGKSQEWFQKPSKFSGSLDAAIKITRHEGIRSLWSGMPPTLVMAVPTTVIYFTCYEQLKLQLGYSELNSNDWWKPMCAGIMGRFLAVSVISPLELVRTKIQSAKLSYLMVGKFLREEVKHRGILSMWRGLAPSLLRDVPFSGIYWFCYERIKAQMILQNCSADLQIHQTMIAGATAGSIAAVITVPFDVIKTHKQISLGLHEPNCPQLITRLSTWSLMKHLYQNQGIKSLFAGIVPRLVKVAPACAIMITSFEYCKQYFRKMNKLAEESKANGKRIER